MKRALGAFALCLAMGSAALAAPAAPGDAVFATLLKSPTGPEWRALERTFPKEIHALFADVEAKLKKSGFSPALNQELAQGSTAMLKNNMHYSSQASDQSLIAFGQAQARLLETLNAESAENCAYMMLHAGLPAGAHTPQTTAAYQDMVIAQIELIRSGRDQPVSRGRLGLEDVRALAAEAEASGVPRADIDSLINGSVLSLSAHSQCVTLTGLLRAASAVPAASGGRYMAQSVSADVSIGTNGAVSAQLVLKQLEDLTVLGPSFKRFEQAYPAETAALGREMAAAMNSGRGGAAQLMAETLKPLIKTHNAMASAPGARLVAFLRAQADVSEEINRRDPAACADYLAGRGLKSIQLEDVTPRVERLTAALLDLLTDARLNPTFHGPLQPEEVDSLGQAVIASGIAPDAARAVMEGRVTSLPVADQCRAQIGLWRAIVQLPPESADRAAAAILAGQQS
jgi:hypothetical protein